MGQIKIIVEGGALELLPKSESKFYVTKVAHDLRDLQTRNASFSKAITIPRSAGNATKLWENLVEFSRDSTASYAFMPCEVLISDMPVVSNGQLAVVAEDKIGKTITVQIFGGIVDLFEAIPETKLSALDWSSESFDWSLTSLAPYFNSDAGLLIGWNTWNLNSNYEKAVVDGITDIQITDTDINFSGAWYHIITLFKKILDPLPGFQFDYSGIEENTNINEALIMFPVTRLFENFTAVENLQGVRESGNITLPNRFPNEGAVNLDFPVLKVDEPSGFWDPVNLYYTIGTSGFYTISVELNSRVLEGVALRDYGSWSVRTGSNGVDARVLYTKDVFVQFETAVFNTSIYLNAGEFVRITYTARTDELVPTGSEFNYKDSTFDVQGGGNVFSRYVDLSKYTPDITQKDFIKAVLELYHLVPFYNDGLVTFKNWESLVDGEWLDLSQYVVKDREHSIVGFIQGYGQNNIFEYTNDEDVEREGTSFEFPQLNELLPTEKVKIKSAFSASDPSKAAGDTALTAPLFPYEYFNVTASDLTVSAGSVNFATSQPHDLKVGDYIFAKNTNGSGNQGRRIVTALNGDTGGALDFAYPENSTHPYERITFIKEKIGLRIGLRTPGVTRTIRDGGTNVGALQRGVLFGDALSWAGLAAVYYPNFVALMEKPTMEQIWFRFPVAVFVSIDPSIPVYIENRVYYLNKLEQYNASNFCRAELIELKKQQEPILRAYYRVAPGVIDFGLVDEAATVIRNTIITNTGDLPIEFTLSAITGPDFGAFAFIAPSPVGSFTLQVNETQQISVEVTMGAGFDKLEAQFDVLAVDPDIFDVTVPMTATPTKALTYFVSPNPLDWGVVANPNTELSTFIENTGDGPISFDLSAIVGAEPAGYTFVSPTPGAPFAVNPGATQEIRINFARNNGATGANDAEFTVQALSAGLIDTIVTLNAIKP